MALPSSGPISMSQVRTELGRSSGPISLGDSDVRNLAGRPSGSISMSDLHGKSNITYTQYTFSPIKRFYGDDKVQFEWYEYTYNHPVIPNGGSLNPQSYKGAAIRQIAFGGIVESQVEILGNHPKNFFSRLEVVGVGNIYTSDSIRTYSSSTNITRWYWGSGMAYPSSTASRTIRIYP